MARFILYAWLVFIPLDTLAQLPSIRGSLTEHTVLGFFLNSIIELGASAIALRQALRRYAPELPSIIARLHCDSGQKPPEMPL